MKQRLPHFIVPMLMLLLLSSRVVHGQIYVNHLATGADNGTTWPNAFNHLQDALDDALASETASVIWVAKGTYYPDETTAGGDTDDRDDSFVYDTDGNVWALSIFGGFDGTETMESQRDPVANETILSGEIQQDDPVDHSDNARNIILLTDVDDGFRLDGFIIRDAGGSVGGGIRVFGSETGAALFENLRFIDNEVTDNGGAFATASQTSEFRSCHFEGNSAGVSTADSGGAVDLFRATAVFVNCDFVGNTARIGGAIHIQGGAGSHNLTVVNCGFYGNTADGQSLESGGAIATSIHDELHIINCLFSGNEADGNGGAVSSGDPIQTVVGCTFANNIADADDNDSGQGGGIYMSDSTNMTVENCILFDNEDADADEVDAQVTMTNGTLTFDHCCVEGLTNSGTNIGDDPQWVDPDGADLTIGTIDDDLELQDDSPCIEIGDSALLRADSEDVNDNSNTTEPHPWDLNDDDREAEFPAGSTAVVDMGAYEFQPSCIGDLDYDGDVDAADLAILLGNWNECPNPCVADLAEDNEIVNAADLAVLLGSWGPCGAGESYEEATGGCWGDLDGDDDIDVVDLHLILESFRCSSSCGNRDLDEDGDVDEVDLDILVGELWCGDDNQDDLADAMAEIGLTESDWDDMVASFGTEDEDNYVCWMVHYVVCDPFCEHTLETCPGADPY